MATPKMSTRRPRSVLDQDRYTAELSTGQLVIGVCILLMFGLGCFLLGVLIGKFDPTLKPGLTTTASSPGDTAPPEVKVAEVTISSAPVSPETSTVESAMPPEMRVPPRILNDSPEQAPVTTGSSPAANTATSSPAPSAPSVADSVGAAVEKNRVAPPGAVPQVVNTQAHDSEPSATAATNTAAPAVAAPAPAQDGAWKGFGVQIIAVAKERAEAARKTVESKSSYKARVLPHTRSNLFRVVVGPYADQAAATRARDELRSRFGYKDAFVLTL